MTPAFDLVVRGGTVVTAGRQVTCDVGVREGRIVELGHDLPAGHQEIAAAGHLVLPGAVDAHCHIEQESSTGLMTADDFRSATRAAACGGTTTVIPFAAQHRGQDLLAVAQTYLDRARDKALIDYGFHLIVSDPDERALTETLPALIERGFTSFKVFMTYDALKLTDRQILDVLALARRERALVMVHAENSDAIAWLSARLVASGCTAPRYHATARPQATEREAVHRVITLAGLAEAPIFIVHVSGAEALEEIRRARARGAAVHAETCPQYLFFTEQDLDRPGFEGAKYMFSPPPRDVASQEALWRALADGPLEVLSTDHAPYRYADPAGKAVHGTDAPFTKIPNGMPGLEASLPVVFSEGVLTGRLSLERFVALTATNPARIYGLYPRKGTITKGADADLAIWDPSRVVTITNDRLHHAMDYTPYEGRRVTGWPVTTISRGDVVWSDGRVADRPGRGLFLPRARFDPVLAAGAPDVHDRPIIATRT